MLSTKEKVPRRDPRERLLGRVLFLGALAYFLAATSWTAFPGLPAWMLWRHLEPGPLPLAGDPLWGGLMRLLARCPGLSAAGWAGLFSAVCGAGAVALLARLMMRTAFFLGITPAPTAVSREVEARLLSGVVAGLALAGSIPFGVAATRSLPLAFHLLLLLTAAWCFSCYQNGGRLRHLGLAGLLCGLGIAEFPTFLVLLPVIVLAVLREMFFWRALSLRKAHLLFWGGLAAGLLLVPAHAEMLFRAGRAAGAALTRGQALEAAALDPLRLLARLRFHDGFAALLFLAAAPWLLLFTMSTRSPCYYDWGKVGVRLVFLGGLLAVLFDAPFAPWRLLGPHFPVATPYLLAAACLGYMAGEFWILGECPKNRAVGSPRFRQHVSAGLALLLPVVLLGACAWNWRIVDGRSGRFVTEVARDILARMGGRDLLFTASVIDDVLRLCAREEREDLLVISAGQVSSPSYLRALADRFQEPELRDSLRQGDFVLFADRLLLTATGPERIGIFERPDVFREYGYLAPAGFLYLLEPTPERRNAVALAAEQKSFWAEWERAARQPLPPASLARPYQDQLRQLAAKMANDLAVLQLEQADVAGALETLRTARRMNPDNVSVLLNLLAIGRNQMLPETAELAAAWEDGQTRLGPARWSLAREFGLVWQPAAWVTPDTVWVLSGAPATAEGARGRPRLAADRDPNEPLEEFLDLAYLSHGLATVSEAVIFSRLQEDERLAFALLELGRRALRRNEVAPAEACFAAAVARGLPEEEIRFDRAMAAQVGGDTPGAVAQLLALSRKDPHDLRVWMALALLTGPQEPAHRQALKVLQNSRPDDLGAQLSLARFYQNRQQWAEAQTVLEQIVQQAPKFAKGWEMLVEVARARNDAGLASLGEHTLARLDPNHPLAVQAQTFALYRQNRLIEAEALLREALRRSRSPQLLDGLAHVIMDRQGDVHEVRQLVEEALRTEPGNAAFRITRAELDLKTGRLEAAGQTLQAVLAESPDHVPAQLLLARWHAARGDHPAALATARALAARRQELSAEHMEQVRKLLVYLQQP